MLIIEHCFPEHIIFTLGWAVWHTALPKNLTPKSTRIFSYNFNNISTVGFYKFVLKVYMSWLPCDYLLYSFVFNNVKHTVLRSYLKPIIAKSLVNSFIKQEPTCQVTFINIQSKHWLGFFSWMSFPNSLYLSFHISSFFMEI